MAMTLAMRNMWVRPEGTVVRSVSCVFFSTIAFVFLKHTVSVIVQVGELVAPLGDDAQGIFEEGDDDEESANRRDITATKHQQL